MKRKIAVLSLTTIIALTVVGCSSEKNKEMKNTMIDVSHQIGNIDKNKDKTNNDIKLTYKQAQELMEKISFKLSEFKPELTPDKQTIILNLATREELGKLEQEYIIINMIANKSNYDIKVEGSMFKDKDILKNDSAVRVLYDLLTSTKSIKDISISKFRYEINDKKANNIKLDKNSTSFNSINFKYYDDIVKFNIEKTYKREILKTNEVKYTYEEYKNQREILKTKLTKYSEEFAKSNNLRPVVYEPESSENSKISTFGVEGDNHFSTYISVNTDIPRSDVKSVSDVCKFKVPTNIEDAKARQLSRDYLVGAIKIINSVINSNINYGDIENLVNSNNIRSKYLSDDSNLDTIFELSNNTEKSLINNEYTYKQKINII